MAWPFLCAEMHRRERNVNEGDLGNSVSGRSRYGKEWFIKEAEEQIFSNSKSTKDEGNQ